MRFSGTAGSALFLPLPLPLPFGIVWKGGWVLRDYGFYVREGEGELAGEKAPPAAGQHTR